MLSIYYTAFGRQQRMNELEFRSSASYFRQVHRDQGHGDGRNTSSHHSSNSNALQPRPPMRRRRRRSSFQELTTDTKRQALIYVGGYVITWICPMISMFFNLFNKPLPIVIRYLFGVFFPSQGIWNFIGFIRPRFKIVSAAHPRRNILEKLQIIVFDKVFIEDDDAIADREPRKYSLTRFLRNLVSSFIERRINNRNSVQSIPKESNSEKEESTNKPLAQSILPNLSGDLNDEEESKALVFPVVLKDEKIEDERNINSKLSNSQHEKHHEHLDDACRKENQSSLHETGILCDLEPNENSQSEEGTEKGVIHPVEALSDGEEANPNIISSFSTLSSLVAQNYVPKSPLAVRSPHRRHSTMNIQPLMFDNVENDQFSSNEHEYLGGNNSSALEKDSKVVRFASEMTSTKRSGSSPEPKSEISKVQHLSSSGQRRHSTTSYFPSQKNIQDLDHAIDGNEE